MGIKQLNQMTKAELLNVINDLQTTRISDGREITLLTGRLAAADHTIEQLSNEITSLERRRLNEGNGYRRVIARMRNPRTVPPSQDESIPDEALTTAQRVLRGRRHELANA